MFNKKIDPKDPFLVRDYRMNDEEPWEFRFATLPLVMEYLSTSLYLHQDYMPGVLHGLNLIGVIVNHGRAATPDTLLDIYAQAVSVLADAGIDLQNLSADPEQID